MTYEEKLVYETEGDRGLAERGYYGEAEREAELQRQRWDADHESRLDDDEFDNCCQFVADGYIHCSAIGSEDCDWCPNRDEIGQKAEPAEDADQK